MNPNFWEPTLRYIESLIQNDMNEANAAETEEARKKIIRNSQPVSIFLSEPIKRYAQDNNLRLQPPSRQAPLISASIKTNPPGMTIKMLHVLEWYILQKQGYNPLDAMDQIATGDAVPIYTGTYIVIIEGGGVPTSRATTTKTPMCDGMVFDRNAALRTYGDGKGRIRNR